MESYWGPKGILGGLLGLIFASLGPSGDPMGTLGAVQEPLGTIFINLGAPRALTGRIFNDFSLNFKIFMYFLKCEINRFPYTHVYQI